MSILIIGAPEEAHSAFVYEKIRARSGQPVYFDTRQFPSFLKISMSPDRSTGSLGCISDPSLRVPLEEIQSVYWRFHMGLQLPQLPDQFLMDMAHREIESTIGSLFRMLDCLWVNPPEAIAMHVFKTLQLKVMHEAGLRIPETLVTNDPDAVIEFYERLNGNVIFKPVRGGAHTEKLKPEDLKPERLKELAKAPVQFQEMINGVDVRVYLVGDELFAGEIRAKSIDFRADPEAEIVPVTLPDTVAEDCKTVGKVLGLVFSGIDVRRTPQGEHVFLEGNPSPMFMHFERMANYPISDRLVDMLMQGK